MACLGRLVLVTLAAAVRQDPHLWGQLLAIADHQARSHGNQLNGQLARLVTPSPHPGGTP